VLSGIAVTDAAPTIAIGDADEWSELCFTAHAVDKHGADRFGYCEVTVARP
jgi:hypothetical protein